MEARSAIIRERPSPDCGAARLHPGYAAASIRTQPLNIVPRMMIARRDRDRAFVVIERERDLPGFLARIAAPQEGIERGRIDLDRAAEIGDCARVVGLHEERISAAEKRKIAVA